MRIALTTANYQPAAIRCGVGDYTRYLRAALEARGHPCTVVTSAQSRSDEPGVHRVSGRWGAGDAAAAWRVLAAARPDAVIFQYTPELYGFGPAFKVLPLACRRLPSRPLVLTTFHTLVGGRWIANPYAVLLAAACHGVISTNAELTDLFHRRLAPWRGRLREIPIGSNIPTPQVARGVARRRLRECLGLPAEARVLGTFGFPSPGKGLDTLLHALAKLKADPVIHLVCLGEAREMDRAYRASLDGLARQLGLEPRVHWLGGLPEQQVSDLLLGVDAYVVPYDDGASLRRGTLMAGFRAGPPIVTTTPSSPDPALRPGETILAVPPRSPDALAEALARLLADPNMQDALRRGTARLADRFAWSVIAAAYVDFVQALQKKEQQA